MDRCSFRQRRNRGRTPISEVNAVNDAPQSLFEYYSRLWQADSMGKMVGDYPSEEPAKG